MLGGGLVVRRHFMVVAASFQTGREIYATRASSRSTLILIA
jgi:hypothetical protein